MKISGRELSAFVQAAWPGDDWYWDHDLFDEPVPDETYDTDDIGSLMYQGIADDPTRGNGYDLAKLVRKWRKDRDFDTFTIEVPKNQVDRVRVLLAGAGINLLAAP